MVTQDNEELLIQWNEPPSSSLLRYAIQYDTVPPSSGALFTRNEIQGLSTRIPKQNLVFDRACSVGVRARDERTGFYGSWSYSESCFVNTLTPPEMPMISNNGQTYDYPLYVLQWDPPSDTNGLISEYIVSLRNVTAKEENECNTICNQGTYEYSFMRKPESRIYQEKIEVTDSTCFCAAVEARNGAGSSSPTIHFIFYPVIAPTSSVEKVLPTVGSSRVDQNCNNEEDTPIVAILLGVVLVVVLIVTVILAIVFIKLYTAQMKQGKGSKSSREL